LTGFVGFVGFGSPGSTALMYAAHGGHEDVCTVLLEARASLAFAERFSMVFQRDMA